MGCIQCAHSGSMEDNVSMVSYTLRSDKVYSANVPDSGFAVPYASSASASTSRDVVTTTPGVHINLRRRRQRQDYLTPNKYAHLGAGVLSTLDIMTLIDTRRKGVSFPSWGRGAFNVVCSTGDEAQLNSALAYDDRPSKNAYNAVQNNLRRNMGGDLDLASVLAMNALELTAPASDALLKNRKNAWVQLAGHAGSFAPAGPNTIWKKRPAKDNNETKAYQELMADTMRPFVPRFYREVDYNGEHFIEMEDLLQHFSDPNIMDIKMGTRTFLESEVKNPVVRKDLYEKMIKLDPNEPTAEEHEEKAITKLRYMQFREKGSSTSTLGFRVDALRMSGKSPNTDLKKVKSKVDVMKTMTAFLNGSDVLRNKFNHQLKCIREAFTLSSFFKKHEIVGSSLLLMYDHYDKVGVWMIDFAKTLDVGQIRQLNHKTPWVYGNHEDGYLLGLENLIETFTEMDMTNFIPKKKKVPTATLR